MRKIGVIGAGSRANIIDAVKDFPEWQIACFCDTDPAMKAKVNEKYPDARFTSDYRDLLNDKDICLRKAGFDATFSINGKRYLRNVIFSLLVHILQIDFKFNGIYFTVFFL